MWYELLKGGIKMTEFESYVIEQLNILNNKIDYFILNKVNNYTPGKVYTFYEWCEEWYETYKKPNLSTEGLKNIRFNLDNHIKPNIENINLNEITALDIQRALNKIKLSYTRKYTFNNLNNMFRYAKRLKVVGDNIMLDVDKVKHTYINGQALTLQQQSEFMRIIKCNKLEALYKFYLLSGVRRSEALSIKWCDIDFDANIIYVKGTKTDCANRHLPLFEDLKKLLLGISRKSEFVFPITLNALKCNFKRIQKKLNFNFSIHELRHTFATRCLESGISIKVVQQWLGHSKMETTANIYSHVLSDFEIKEIKKYNIKVG